MNKEELMSKTKEDLVGIILDLEDTINKAGEDPTYLDTYF